MEDLARFRQAAYRFLGALFMYPDAERFRELVGVARVLARDKTFAVFPFFQPWQRLTRFLTRQNGGPPLDQIEQEYVRIFLANSAGVPCPPFESYWSDPGGQAAAWVPLQLRREYAEVGLVPSPAVSQVPDHVTVELEFMAFLCAREAEAWARKDVGLGLETLRREHGFLGKHLGRWFPTFAREVIRADRTGLYALAAEAAAAFMHHDSDLLSLLIRTLREVKR